MRKLLLLLLFLPTIVFAQGTATRLRSGSSLPTACGNGDVFYKTTSPIGTHECSVPGNPGTWRPIYGASTSAGGSDTQVQYNCSGSFCGNSQLTYDATNHIAGFGNGTSRGVITIHGAAGNPSSPSGSLDCAIAYDSTAGTLVFINHSGTSCGPSAGTVTHTGTLTATQLLCGNGSADIAVCNLSGDATTTNSGVVTVVKVNGVSHAASPSTDSVEVVTAANTATAKIIPDCTDTSGNHLNYTQSTHTISCGTSSSGGGGSGSLILLEQHTASASATLDFTTAFTSTYDEYIVEIVGLQPATNAVGVRMLVSTNGGSTWDTSSNYRWQAYGQDSSNSVGGGVSTSDTSFNLGESPTLSNTSTATYMGTLHLFNLLTSSQYFSYYGDTFGQLYSDSRSRRMWNGGSWASAAAVNAIQFKTTSGNIAAGTIRVYGVAK
jgi:hypothetical protein